MRKNRNPIFRTVVGLARGFFSRGGGGTHRPDQRHRRLGFEPLKNRELLYFPWVEMNCSCPWDRVLVYHGRFAEGTADDGSVRGRTEVKDGMVPSAFVGGRAADCGRGATGASPRADAAENGYPVAAAPWAHPRKGGEDCGRRLGDGEPTREGVSGRRARWSAVLGEKRAGPVRWRPIANCSPSRSGSDRLQAWRRRPTASSN